MTLKQKAILKTFGMVVSMVFGSMLAVLILSTFTLMDIAMFATIAVFAFMVYMMYKINLSQLEYKQKLDEMVKK